MQYINSYCLQLSHNTVLLTYDLFLPFTCSFYLTYRFTDLDCIQSSVVFCFIYFPNTCPTTQRVSSSRYLAWLITLHNTGHWLGLQGYLKGISLNGNADSSKDLHSPNMSYVLPHNTYVV
jgi:hypothetical protein